MEFDFGGDIFYWRGPSPFHFVAVPEADCTRIREMASLVSYGWGVIPVRATIGRTTFTTSLFPKDGGYLLPLKDAVRRAEKLELGQDVHIQMTLGR